MATHPIELEMRVRALEHWIKFLFATQADPGGMAAAVKSHITAIKNQSPADEMDPAAYDKLTAKIIPAIEYLGKDISTYLLEVEEAPKARRS